MGAVFVAHCANGLADIIDDFKNTVRVPHNDVAFIVLVEEKGYISRLNFFGVGDVDIALPYFHQNDRVGFLQQFERLLGFLNFGVLWKYGNYVINELEEVSVKRLENSGLVDGHYGMLRCCIVLLWGDGFI